MTWEVSGEPYKLKLKPDPVPVKHRPRKVPVDLKGASHDEGARLGRIDVLQSQQSGS